MINEDWKTDGFGGVYDDYTIENSDPTIQRIKRSEAEKIYESQQPNGAEKARTFQEALSDFDFDQLMNDQDIQWKVLFRL